MEFPIIKNGFKYSLLNREGNKALVIQENLKYEDAPERYEIWRIRREKKKEFKGVTIPAREVAPATKNWGKDGFTFIDLRDATLEFKSIKFK